MYSIPTGWKYKNLEELVEVNPKTKRPDPDKMVSFLSMSDVSENGQIIGGLAKQMKRIGSGYPAFKDNDVLVAKITPCFENGKGALATKLQNGFGFGSTEFHILRAGELILPEYLLLVTQTHHFRATGEINMTGSAGQKRVPADYLKYYPILVPPSNEQTSIVMNIKKWNRSIELIESLIATKQERRQWLMQQLLTGKHRAPGFSNKWATKRMKNLVEPIQRPVPKPTEPYKALGIRSHCKGTFERQVSDPNTVDMDTLFIARKGDLMVNITFAWEGAIAFVPKDHDGYLVSHRFPTYRLKESEVDADFLRYMVTQPRFIFTLGLISPGGAGRNRVMSKRDFLEIELSVPSLEEQRKIGKILKLVDQEIALLSKRLVAIREQKKGLMQKLLSGKVRVNV